jgi:hypothetical protein
MAFPGCIEIVKEISHYSYWTTYLTSSYWTTSPYLYVLIYGSPVMRDKRSPELKPERL